MIAIQQSHNALRREISDAEVNKVYCPRYVNESDDVEANVFRQQSRINL